MKTQAALIPIAASIFFAALLAGCEAPDKGEEVRSLDWYESHHAERAEKLAECMASPGTLDGTPNCVNASRAENNAQGATKWATESEGVRTTPPVTN